VSKSDCETNLTLRVVYEDESQYCYIAVRSFTKGKTDKRVFMQDQLKHSEIIMGDIKQLQYEYSRIFAAVTRRLLQGRDKLSAIANKLAHEGRFNMIMPECNRLVRHNPEAGAKTYSEIGVILAKLEQPAMAVEFLRKALLVTEKAQIQDSNLKAAIYSNLSLVLKKTGQTSAAKMFLDKASSELQKQAKYYPDSAKIRVQLGDVLASNGKYNTACDVFTEVIALDPMDSASRFKCVQLLEYQKRYNKAISVLENGIRLAAENNMHKIANNFTEYLVKIKKTMK